MMKQKKQQKKKKTLKAGIAASTRHEGADLVPPGAIVMWSGLVDTIPEGWALCDGKNGTPDLRDRFIAAAGSKYEAGTKGGLDKVALKLEEMPSHTHSGVASGGGHTHAYSSPNELQKIAAVGGSGKQCFKYNKFGSRNTSGSSDHKHAFSIKEAGKGKSHENCPPFFALAFIMKL